MPVRFEGAIKRESMAIQSRHLAHIRGAVGPIVQAQLQPYDDHCNWSLFEGASHGNQRRRIQGQVPEIAG